MRRKLPPHPWLPREREMSERLNAEERKDVDALLNAEERAEYVFREEASSLGRELDKYGVTDAELRAMYQAQQERAAAWRRVEERYPGFTLDPFRSVSAHDPQAVAEIGLIDSAYDQRMKEVFGAERLAKGDREADPAYPRIKAVTRKFGLDARRTEEIYDLLKRAREEAERDTFRDEGWAARQAKRRRVAVEQIGKALPAEAVGLLLGEIDIYHYWLRER